MSNTISQGDILLVDDAPANLNVLSNLLSNYGYKVRPANNGDMALLIAQNAMPDLILLDIQMPVMDGYEVCQHLKANPQTKAIPVIFLTALDEVMDKVKAFEVGGADYITKPFQIEEVLARVKVHIALRQQEKQRAQVIPHVLNVLDEALESLANVGIFDDSQPAQCILEARALLADL